MPFQPSPLLDAARTGAPPADARSGMPARAQRAAALLLRAPIATVCLLDGGPMDGLARGAAPLPGLPCSVTPAAPLYAEVVRRRAPLVIGDAGTVDVPPMLAALRAQAWQAFVAVPLLTASGTLRGVLAVADVVPRSWRAEEVAALVDLATLAADAYGVGGDEGARWVRAVAQREAQEARRKSEQWLALVFNSTADLTFLMSVEEDGRYRCVAVNDSYLAVTGFTESEVVGHDLADFLPADAAARMVERYGVAVRGGEPLHYEECVLLPVGTLQMETLLTPIVDDAGRCTYLLGVARDVTARRQAEDELRAAKQDAEQARAVAEAARREAERASHAKSDFLSRMSHELRTPLNAVIGFANVLRVDRAGRLDERERDYLGRIVANGQHLLSIVGDLLDIARIEAGRMPLAPCDVPLGPLVRMTVGSFETHVGESAVELRTEIPDTLGRVEADPTRLQQVLVNLIANALRCTPRGTVTVRVVADEASGRPLRVEVEDTGVGIPVERLEAIFEAFEQGGAGSDAPQGACGLGLAISRSLCRHMGFALRVRSAPGEGSTFTIDLTGAEARMAARRAPRGPAVRRR